MQRVGRIVFISLLVLYGFYLYQPSLFKPWIQALEGNNSAALSGADTLARKNASQQARAAQQFLIANAEQQTVSLAQLTVSFKGSAEALCLHGAYTSTIGVTQAECLAQLDTRTQPCLAYLQTHSLERLDSAEKVRRQGKLYIACLMDLHFDLSPPSAP